MKKKIIGGVLVTGVLAALVAGGTMAWFTDSAEVAATEFTAGTVIVSADNKEVKMMDGRFIDNINPGDCATVIWDITNEGTKKAELRVKLSDKWSNTDEWPNGLPTSNVHYTPAKDSGWVTVTENGETWFYYINDESVAGTYKDQDPTTISLPIVIGFDGEFTDNKYQAKTYEIKGEVEAVQATNGAPAAVWGSTWTLAKGGRNDIDDYFVNGLGKDMICWTGKTEEPEEPEEPEVPVVPEEPVVAKYLVTLKASPQCGGAVSGGGSFVKDQDVTVKAEPGYKWLGINYTFVNWTEGGVEVSKKATYTFKMGDKPRNLVANFK